MRISLFLLLSFASSAYEIRIPFENLEPRIKNLDETFTLSMWGGYQRIWSLGGASSNEYFYQVEDEEFPYYVRIYHKEAPLIIFFPGMFGNHERGIVLGTTEKLEKFPAHLLIVPNVVNHKYLKAVHPIQNKSKPWVVDKRITKELIDLAITKIGKDRINSIEVLGESLGSMMATAIYPDLQKKKSLTLICPPINLRSSMQQFDQYVHEVKEIQSKKSWWECSRAVSYINMLINFSWQNQDFEEDFKQCMKIQMINTSFLREAFRSVQAFNPKIQFLRDFSSFFKHYAPGLFQKMLVQDVDETTLVYWLSKISQKDDVHILSSKNDFINDPQQWEHKSFTEYSVQLEEWGGHCAFFGVPGFEDEYWKLITDRQRSTRN